MTHVEVILGNFVVKDFFLHNFTVLSFQTTKKKYPSVKDLEKYLHQHQQKHGGNSPRLTTPVEISSMYILIVEMPNIWCYQTTNIQAKYRNKISYNLLFCFPFENTTMSIIHFKLMRPQIWSLWFYPCLFYYCNCHKYNLSFWWIEKLFKKSDSMFTLAC